MNRAAMLLVLVVVLVVVVPASAPAAVRTCRPATVFRAYDRVLEETVVYRASHIRRTSRIGCRKAIALLRMAYGQGPITPIHVEGPEEARPVYWARGGWRATNGAGGATAWNVKDRRLNEVGEWAVTADVDVR